MSRIRYALFAQSSRLYQLLPGRPFGLPMDLVIFEILARTRLTEPDTWQDAWNEATGARPDRRGQLRFYADLRCSNCNGKRVDLRRGHLCYVCNARGKVNTLVNLQALYAQPDQPDKNGGDTP